MSCPYKTSKTNNTKPKSLQEWWPNQINLRVLSQEKRNNPNPREDYIQNLLKLDIESLKKDLHYLLTNSQEWWPADYNHYGPLMVRMAWHSAGTYRVTDGKGGSCTGNLRFAPLNSWPDNANLDKAKRLLWPIKQKYGSCISWADLMILAGNVALESMAFKTFGFAFGRVDVYAPEDDIDWGSEQTWLAADEKRYPSTDGRNLSNPLGAVQMGLIYVNPEGPNANPDPLLAAHDIRETFRRMSMNDEETVALIAGGHTFGKAHGAAAADRFVGPEPEGATLEEQGLGWTSSYKSGKGLHTITSGLEGAWTSNPIKWDNGYFYNLFEYEWKQTKSPAGATQWIPVSYNGVTVPDAHDPFKQHLPIMFTTDLALRYDPVYAKISKRFYQNPQQFQTAFAKAWYKLTHRDLGPISKCFGPDVPPAQLWQDPLPKATNPIMDAYDVHNLKHIIQSTSNLTISQLVKTAWASASTYRFTDHRGGANGARIRLAPQKDWPVNNTSELATCLKELERIQTQFNLQYNLQVSLADVIVLAGCAAIELAAERAGYKNIRVPFSPGRTDALQEKTDIDSFQYLEPKADGFRNYYSNDNTKSPEEMLVDKAHMLTLTAPEMTVLIGGLRVLDTNTSDKLGVLTNQVGVLTNDFFVNLLDMSTVWKSYDQTVFHGVCRSTQVLKWKASRVDLLFGSNSELRSIAEYYACHDSQETFVHDFINAWVKVMNLDRFDLRRSKTSCMRSRL